MDNLYFTSLQTNHYHKQLAIEKVAYEQSASLLIILTKQKIIHYFTYDSKTKNIIFKQQSEIVQQLIGKNVLLMAYLVETENLLIITQEGSIMTITNNQVDMKAQNDQGIVGATISPMQQYIYVATKNRTLIQLDMQYDLVKEIPIDDQQLQYQATEKDVNFTWRMDGKFFSINYPIKNGRKCLTRDLSMNITKSPAKSDPDPEGLVQSVTEKPQPINKCLSWQPLGGMIAGYNHQKKDIIFWQKNGLRHLEFKIFEEVQDVHHIHWIPCKPRQHQQVLVIETTFKDKTRKLLFYYRANYHWYLKNCIDLKVTDEYLFIQASNHTNIFIFQKTRINIIQITLKVSQNEYNGIPLFYVIDGDKLQLTNFDKAVIPPPMAEKTLKLSLIRHVSRIKSSFLIVLENQIVIYDYLVNKQIKRIKLVLQNGIQWNQFTICNLDVVTLQPLKIIINNALVEQCEDKLTLSDHAIIQNKQKITPKVYSYQWNSKQYRISLNSTILSLEVVEADTITLTQQCTSFTFYNQFILFTTFSSALTSQMFQKLYVFNLELDKWLLEGKIEQFEKLQKKDTLNVRNIQRGSIIMGCSKGRCVFQLPRGNLQTFYPKIISIYEVKKAILNKQYKRAFELIRTHKLDLNLIFDIDCEGFLTNCQLVLKSIQKTDYINLFISQLKQELSSEMVYCYETGLLEKISNQFEIKYKGNKINMVCTEVVSQLRKIDKSKYILSIFTAQIKNNHLQQVLFELKQMKIAEGIQNDNISNLPPHLTQKPVHKSKNSQQILEYVCWLVDADAIYEASLLTYDLELSSMTARCTQKDPKQYIPYLEALKIIEHPVELKKKVCLDLKKYDRAIKQLAQGTQEHKKQAIQLVRKHKLFKCGLLTFNKTLYEREVKLIIIDELINKNQFNEAFNLCFSIKCFDKALQIAIQQLDAKKVLQVYNFVEKPQPIQSIIEKFKQSAKKGDLALLFKTINNYEQAARFYLKASDYKGAYQCIHKLSEKFIEEQLKPGFTLAFSLMKNHLIKERTSFLQKYNRLQSVQKQKQLMNINFSNKNRGENEDMYSQISVSSKSGSQYTISTTTGMRKKKDKKKNILNRNVKQGSILEEQYLIAYLADLKSRSQDIIKQTKILIQNLIYLTLLEEATILRNQAKNYILTHKYKTIKTAGQLRFEEDHPQAKQLYAQQQKSVLSIDSFDYLL